MDNALKYTPEGGHVVVSAERHTRTAVVRVRDDGPGVPDDEKARIWERLYRCDYSRSESGLGLGLSMVRAIMRAHDGDATLKDAPDGGSVFELKLPL